MTEKERGMASNEKWSSQVFSNINRYMRVKDADGDDEGEMLRGMSSGYFPIKSIRSYCWKITCLPE